MAKRISEPVRLELSAPTSCVDESALNATLVELSARIREPRPDERARTFHVAVSGSSPMTVTLRITDLAFETTTRESIVKDCEQARRTAALFISLAADEDRTTEVAATPAPRMAAPLSLRERDVALAPAVNSFHAAAGLPDDTCRRGPSPPASGVRAKSSPRHARRAWTMSDGRDPDDE